MSNRQFIILGEKDNSDNETPNYRFKSKKLSSNQHPDTCKFIKCSNYLFLIYA